MAKGSIAKEQIFTKIKEVYPDAFMDDKVLRIPMMEEGAMVEIKVALTCAKDVIGSGGGTVIPTTTGGGYDFEAPAQTVNTAAATAPTDQEKENVANLLKALQF